jgi:protocatechuate 3,4-dioxygenase alpha subunit
MSADESLVATSSQTVGPFFHFGLTTEPNGRMIDRLRTQGEPVTLAIRVTDGAGEPVPDAMIELLQAGAFGRMPTDVNGVCEFETARPGSIEGPGPSGQAPHIFVCVFARGLLRQMHTRIYFAGDPLIATDPVLARVPEARRGTLIATPDPGHSGRWIFDLRLQGARETVFFDG